MHGRHVHVKKRSKEASGIEEEPPSNQKEPLSWVESLNLESNTNSGPESPGALEKSKRGTVGDLIRARNVAAGQTATNLTPDASAAHQLIHKYTRQILRNLEEGDGTAVKSFKEAMSLAAQPKGVAIKRADVASIAHSGYFNVLLVATVIMSTIQIGVETDADSPEMSLLAKVIDNVCCSIFVMEVLVRAGAYGIDGYLSVAWNRFDFALCIINVLETWILAHVEWFAAYFRGTIVLRALRLVRIARVLRLFKYFKELWLVLKGLANAMRMVGWVGLLLLVVLGISSILCRQTIAKKDAVDLSDDFDQDQLFGSMGRSMVTLFNIVLLTDEWDIVSRPLYEEHILLFLVLVGFLFMSTFSLLNVIVGVVVDDVIMNQKKSDTATEDQQALAHAEMMWDIYHDFFELDVNSDGVVDLNEFLASPRVSDAIQMVAAHDNPRRIDSCPVGVKCSGKELFDCMDINRDGALNRKEFTRGMIRALEAFRHPKQSVNLLLGQARVLLAEIREMQEGSISPGATPSQAPTTAGGAETFDGRSSSAAAAPPPRGPTGNDFFFDGRSSSAAPRGDTFGAEEESLMDESARLAWLRSQLERNDALLATVARSLGANLSNAPVPLKPPQAAQVPMSARAMSARGKAQQGSVDMLRNLLQSSDPLRGI
jgi:voltage-gated sodium channel